MSSPNTWIEITSDSSKDSILVSQIVAVRLIETPPIFEVQICWGTWKTQISCTNHVAAEKLYASLKQQIGIPQ